MFRNSSSRFILRGLFLFPFVFVLLNLLAYSTAIGSLNSDDWSYLPIVSLFWSMPTPTPQPGRLLINEVLYRPIGAEPEREWIEIVNAGGLPVELTRCKLGDAAQGVQDEGMFVFPGQSVVAPGQVLVVANSARAFQDVYGFNPDYEFSETDSLVPTLIKYRDWSVGNVNLGNSGDEVLLLDENDLVLDAVVWGNVGSELFNPPIPNVVQGHSIARRFSFIDSNTAADWQDVAKPSPKSADFSTPTPIPLPSATPTASVTPRPPLPLLISEVYIQSTNTTSNPGDWIEIYNPGKEVVFLETYQLGDEESQYDDSSEGMYRFPPGAHLQPGEVIVVALGAEEFRAVYGFQPDFEIEDSDQYVPDMILQNHWNNGKLYLSDWGDEVLLLDVNGYVVDAVSWENSTWAFSPAVILSKVGGSIVRWHANHDTNTAHDWVNQAVPDPGQVTALETPTTPSSTPTLDDPSATAAHSPTGLPPATSTAAQTATMTPTVTPTSGALYPLLSEVLYRPVTEENADEWVELYNPTSTIWDLSGYGLGDEETFRGDEGMFRFPPGTSLLPGARLVVAVQGQAFMDYYSFPPDFEVINTSSSIPDLVWEGVWGKDRTIYLMDGGDEILLLDEGLQAVDVLVYGSGSYPGVNAHPGADIGHSLERSPVYGDTDDCSQDFVAQAVPSPGQ